MAKLLERLPFEKIEALTKPQRVLICVSTFLILGGAYFYLIYMPKSGRANELKGRYEKIQTKLARAKAAPSSLEKVQKQNKEAKAKFRLALQQLPDKKEIPSLLESISNSGRKSGLEFILFKPGNETPKGFYAEIPVKIEVEGGYHDLALFFDKVSRLPRIVNISNIKISGVKKSKKDEGRLQASCVATTYRFVELSKGKSAKGKSKKAKKG